MKLESKKIFGKWFDPPRPFYWVEYYVNRDIDKSSKNRIGKPHYVEWKYYIFGPLIMAKLNKLKQLIKILQNNAF